MLTAEEARNELIQELKNGKNQLEFFNLCGVIMTGLIINFIIYLAGK